MSELMQAPLQAGGEWLLFLLFIVFSVVSALLERRKRKKQAEENPQGSSASAGPLAEEKEEEEEEEETGSWPFPMGEDPFDLPQPKQRPEKRPAYERAEEEETAPAAASDPRRTLIEQMEDEAAEAKRLQEAEAVDVYDPYDAPPEALQERARAAERQAQEVQPRRRVQELVQERVELDQRQRRKKKKRPKWLLTPKTARDALVFTEILGKPKSEREEEDFG